MSLSRSSDLPVPQTPFFEAVAVRWRWHKEAGRLRSVRELCKAAGISRTTWYALNDPEHRPTRATVVALADVLDMDVEPLLRLAGFGRSVAVCPVPTASVPGVTER